MNHKYHTELKTKLGLKFTPGSGCDCKDLYSCRLSEKISVVVRKEKCDNGKPDRKCRWEMILVESLKGVINKTSGEDTFVNLQNVFNQWKN